VAECEDAWFAGQLRELPQPDGVVEHLFVIVDVVAEEEARGGVDDDEVDVAEFPDIALDALVILSMFLIESMTSKSRSSGLTLNLASSGGKRICTSVSFSAAM
jgi:hypothetical protein